MAEGDVSASLEEQLSKFPAEILDRQCFESHLGKLVHHITTDTMVMVATDLGLSDMEVEDIHEIWPRNPAKKRLQMFKKWQEKKKSEATYRYSYMCVIDVCIKKIRKFIRPRPVVQTLWPIL